LCQGAAGSSHPRVQYERVGEVAHLKRVFEELETYFEEPAVIAKKRDSVTVNCWIGAFFDGALRATYGNHNFASRHMIESTSHVIPHYESCDIPGFYIT